MNNIGKVIYSLVPLGVALEDFDMKVDLSTDNEISAETSQVGVIGEVTLKNGSRVNFEAPIDKIRLSYEVIKRRDDGFRNTGYHVEQLHLV